MWPPLLKKGDKIGVMAPSSYVEADDIALSKAMLEKRGYEVFVHPQTYERDHQMAGSPLQKAMALQGLWQRKDIGAIWCAGGGNRALQLLDMINYEAVKDKPKALIGFSDITALLSAYNAHIGLVSFHGPVFKELHSFTDEQIEQCLQTLEHKQTSLPLENARTLKSGKAKGPLIGGCLSVFHYLPGTDDCPNMNNAILFLEDAGDHASRFDRMLLHLKRMGVFDTVSGIVLGEFLDVQEGARPFGLSIEDMVMEYLGEREIPVISGAPFGHGKNLYTVPFGADAVLDVKTSAASLSWKTP